MKNKFGFILTLLISICVCACANHDTDKDKALEITSWEASDSHEAANTPQTATTEISTPTPTELEDVDISQIELPKSRSGNIFGNRLNDCNIVYNPEDECYYVSQLNYIDDYQGTTTKDLAFQTKMDKEFLTRTKLSNNSFERLAYIDGKMYDVLNGKLICYYNQTESLVVEEDIYNYCIDGDMVYYTPQNESGLWAKNMSTDAPPIMLPITLKNGLLQASEGKVFFVGENGIYMYGSDKTVRICNVDKVDSFLVDGALIYRDEFGNLVLAGDNRKIAKDVLGYTIVGDKVYYSDYNGLYVYDLLQNTPETLISIDYHANKHKFIDSFHMVIKNIAVYNDKLFLNTSNSRFGLTSILVYCDLDGGNLKPVVDITKPDFQTYVYTEHGFSISYPVGYVINFDPGSYYSYYLMISDPEGKIFMSVRNWKIDDPDFEFDSSYEGYEKIRTNQGYTGYYKIVIKDNRFDFLFMLNDVFTFSAEGEEQDWEIVKPILFEMMKSFEILE